jgi:replicative DNA helicase
VATPRALPIATPYSVASAQIQEALKHARRVSDEFPLPPWKALADVVGPLLPGTMLVVGARPGQGKTSILAGWFSELFRSNTPTLYVISGDGGPVRFRRILAALHCGFARRAVLRNLWSEASPHTHTAEQAYEAFVQEMRQQEEWANVGMVWDAPVLSRESVRGALKFGLRNGAKLVVVDHVNRWTPTSGDLTGELASAIRDLAAVAATKNLVIILAAQITPWAKDSRNVMTEFTCPPVSALKQTQALVEEPHVILLMHRARRKDVTAEDIRLAAVGQRQARDLIEPGIMCATVGKHRDDDTVGATARLRIDRTGYIQDADEREPGQEATPF